MELNVVQNYKEKIECLDLYNKILLNAEKKLQIEENYSLSVIFCDDDYIHEINATYRNIDRTTDVISFALLDNGFDGIEEDDVIELGDIFINIDACKRQSIEYGHSFERELGFLFTHGILHLLGFDHMEPNEEKIMFKKQEEILDEIISR